MSQRLTNSLRETICEKVLKSAGFEKRSLELKKKEAAWAEKVRVSALGGPAAAKKLDQLHTEIGALYAEVPGNLLPSVTGLLQHRQVYLNVMGKRAYFYYKNWDKEKNQFLTVYRVSPYDITVTAFKLVEEWESLEASKQALKEAESTMQAQTMAVLKSVTTIKRLREVWPEIEEHIPQDLTKPVSTLPALTISTLNNQISQLKKGGDPATVLKPKAA